MRFSVANRRGRLKTGSKDVVGGEVVRGPQRAYYQRLCGDYSKVSSNGKLTLTETELRQKNSPAP